MNAYLACEKNMNYKEERRLEDQYSYVAILALKLGR